MGGVGCDVCRNLNPEQLQFFNSQGYLVIESFASKEEVDRMVKRMDEVLEGFDGSTVSVFSTKNQLKMSDDHFYESAENISFFFEENAFGDDGCLIQDKKLSINKVGHALHELEPVFKKFCCSDNIASLLFSLGHQRPVIMQSMYIFKQPGIGGEVVPHQDNSFLYTDPPTCKGLWLALEDATITNGCLWAIPGSHNDGLARKFIRDENGVHFDCPARTYGPNDFIPIEVKAGSMVVLHGDVVHKSFGNHSTKSRHALSFHAVDTEGCKWSSDNWIRRKTEPEPLYAK